MDNILDVLRVRGLVQDISDEAGLRRQLEQPTTLYCGYDATADSLTIGHLVGIMMLAWFQRYGHRPIALMGGGTTLVGDPTGRQTSRPILSVDEIRTNLNAVREQMSRFLDFSEGRALLIDNADWLTKLNYVDFMREIGSRFSVNEILRLEAYRTRLEAGGLSFLELSYVLLQSYDFLQLYRQHDCRLQIGGSDQWGNSIMGADLIRRVTSGGAYVLVSPLLLTSAGVKMGKTAAGAVWLKTPPYEYYQFWRNVEDRDVERFLGIFTFLPMDEVRTLGHLDGAEVNRAKEVLAFEATKLRYGEGPAQDAQNAARSLFGSGKADDTVPTFRVSPRDLESGIPVTRLFKEAGLVVSTNEARRLIGQQGLAIDGVPLTDPHLVVTSDMVRDNQLLLSQGRKKHRRMVLADR